MGVEDQQLSELIEIRKSLALLTTIVSEYIVKAEKEVPEYLRRLSMYYNDMFHMKILWEQAGQQLPPEFKDEIERTHVRLMQCIEEETNQGGKFHHHASAHRREGRTLNNWKGKAR